MKLLIVLAVVVLVKGQTNTPPSFSFIDCKDTHQVDITIDGIVDSAMWDTTEWRLENQMSCDPDTVTGGVVTYTDLTLPDCANDVLQSDDNSTIKYVFKITAAKTTAPATNQLRAYDYMFYAECLYNSNGTGVGNFIPIVKRGLNNTGAEGQFTFDLTVYKDAARLNQRDALVGLDIPLYIRAEVITSSASPNLDLFPLKCWASSDGSPFASADEVVFILNGCGDPDTSEDEAPAGVDTVLYNCADSANSKVEDFIVNSFRYLGAAAGDLVYIHCHLRVCLDDIGTACECPASCPAKRKRRSVSDQFYLEDVYQRAGPFRIVEDEGNTKEQEDSQSSSTTITILAAVSGVAVLAVIVCVTIFLVLRRRNKRRQSNDLHVVT